LLQVSRSRYSGVTVPRITIKTDLAGPDGREEELAEYICDTPGCPNIAVQVLGRVAGLGLFAAVCEQHYLSKQP
jgi:hypothetical protein